MKFKLTNEKHSIKFWIAWLLLGIILVMGYTELVSAENNPCGGTNYYLGTFKQNTTINLTETCEGSSFSNLTGIIYPNGYYEVFNLEMEKNGINYYYQFSNDSQIGCYTYTTLCDVNGINVPDNTDFQITPTGIIQNTGMIVTFVFVILILFIISLYKIFNSHSKVEVTLFISISYFFLLILSYLSWKLTENYLYNMQWIINFFYIMFMIILISMFPLIIGLVIYLFFSMFNERKMKELTGMGYSSEEAKRYK